MGRPPRTAIGGIIYHVINRANGRLPIFETNADYLAFEHILEESKEKHPMRILAYCVMPNHWHLVLYPERDNDMPIFMRWITLTHTQRWHAFRKNTGYGHVYQGRYKSFPVQTDEHFLQLVRYVERNPLRAKLVKLAEDWQWSSLYRREHGTKKQQTLLHAWPVEPTENYLDWVNTPQPQEEVEQLRYHIQRGRPYGEEAWMKATADKFDLGSTFRSRGRPWPKST